MQINTSEDKVFYSYLHYSYVRGLGKAATRVVTDHIFYLTEDNNKLADIFLWFVSTPYQNFLSDLSSNWMPSLLRVEL